jgi:hypothetical protein
MGESLSPWKKLKPLSSHSVCSTSYRACEWLQRRVCFGDKVASRSAKQRGERKRMLSSLWLQATLFEERTSRSIQGEKDLADKISQHMQVNLTYTDQVMQVATAYTSTFVQVNIAYTSNSGFH